MSSGYALARDGSPTFLRQQGPYTDFYATALTRLTSQLQTDTHSKSRPRKATSRQFAKVLGPICSWFSILLPVRLARAL
jgi:hypothetical protein